MKTNPLVTTFQKDATSWSYRLQRILLCIHQYNIKILNRPGLQLFVADWLCRHNHKLNKDKEVARISISINVMETCANIPGCITAEEMQLVFKENEHIGLLSEYKVYG